MKTLILASLLTVLSFGLVADESQKNLTQESASQHKYKEIDSGQLKNLYDQNRSMVILDARSKGYFDGNLLPRAKWLPADSSEEEIRAAIGSNDALAVVYCSCSQCPAGGWLADKLVSMGYTNVYKYPEGIADWMEQGYPIERHN